MKKRVSQKELGNFVIKTQKGDSESFAKLYSYLAPSVYYIVLKIVRNQHDSDDVVQETFIKLYSSIHEIRNPVTVVSFTNRIAYHTALEFLTKRNKVSSFASQELDYEHFSAEPLNSEFIPEEYYEQKEKREEVLQLLDELSEINRAAVFMFYYNDMTIRDISQTLQVSEETVKGRLFRAREKIKTGLINNRNIQKGVFVGMSANVLSKILETDAKALSFAESHVGNWMNIVENIGALNASVEVTKATVSNIVKSNLHIMSDSAAVLAGAGSSVGSNAVKVIAGIISATTIVGTGTVIYLNRTPETPNIDTSITQATTETSPENTVTIRDKEYYISPPSENNVTEFPQETPPQDDLGVVMSDPPLLVVNPELSISLEKYILRYPAGRELTIESIVKDSGVSSNPGIYYQVYYLDQVDIKKPRQYGIYIQAKTGDGLESNIEGIIIIIE